MDFAKRQKDHEYGLDPIVRSLLDTDFYKLAMLQLIWKKYKDIPVTFEMNNRTKEVNLGGIIHFNELNAQLEYVRNLRFTRGEITWLRGNTFYGRKNIFSPEFIDWLEKDFKLSGYSIHKSMKSDKTLEVKFSGSWAAVTMWEIYALTIVNTLRNRALMRNIPNFDLDVTFARAKSKLWNKVEQLQKATTPYTLSDFGTRRRFDFLWQEWVVMALKEGLGKNFLGTSNMLLAMKHDLEPIGTNAHELPMAYAAMCGDDDEALLQSPYKVLSDWEELYSGNMRVILGDTFGTTSFLKNAPDWIYDWRGFRIDSKPNIEAVEEILEHWYGIGGRVSNPLIIHSDGLDVSTFGEDNDILTILDKNANPGVGSYDIGFGWGTAATNDFVGCVPNKDTNYLRPISLVCKMTSANGRPTVKLSDVPGKHMGPAEEVERYKRVFGYED